MRAAVAELNLPTMYYSVFKEAEPLLQLDHAGYCSVESSIYSYVLTSSVLSGLSMVSSALCFFR